MFFSGKYMVFLVLVFFAYWLFLSWRSVWPARVFFIKVAVPALFILGTSYQSFPLLSWKFLELILALVLFAYGLFRAWQSVQDARVLFILGVSYYFYALL